MKRRLTPDEQMKKEYKNKLIGLIFFVICIITFIVLLVNTILEEIQLRNPY